MVGSAREDGRFARAADPPLAVAQHPSNPRPHGVEDRYPGGTSTVSPDRASSTSKGRCGNTPCPAMGSRIRDPAFRHDSDSPENLIIAHSDSGTLKKDTAVGGGQDVQRGIHRGQRGAGAAGAEALDVARDHHEQAGQDQAQDDPAGHAASAAYV